MISVSDERGGLGCETVYGAAMYSVQVQVSKVQKAFKLFIHAFSLQNKTKQIELPPLKRGKLTIQK